MARIIELDNFRGIAFILMFIHHIFYFNDITNNNLYSQNFIIDKIGMVSRTMFIFIAGLSLSINKKKKLNFKKRLKRSLEIAMHALIITLLTLYFYPDMFIRFGILHFFALTSFLLSFIAPYPKLTFIIFIFSLIFKIPSINPSIDIITGATNTVSMMDWFPLNEWLPLILTGLVVGQNSDLSKLKLNNFLSNNNILTIIGQNTLQLYTIHVVFLVIFFIIIKKKHCKYFITI
jgi:uncharacterized membrane protein